MVYEQGIVKTYANGRLVHAFNGVGSIDDAVPDQNEFRIGDRQAFSEAFIGAIDDVRVWNTVRSADEIRRNVGGIVGPVAGLVGHWTFDEASGTVARDSSGFGNHGAFGSRVDGDAPVHVRGPVHVVTLDTTGDIVSLVAESSDPSVFVTLVGNDVFVTGQKDFSGTATITLTAVDGTGERGEGRGRTATRSFDVSFIDNAVYGIKFDDVNRNGVRDPGEALQDGVLVFADTNGNSRLDPGEISSYTDANGEYALRGIVTTPRNGAIVDAPADTVASGGTIPSSTTRIAGSGNFFAPFTNLVSRTDVQIRLKLDGFVLDPLLLTPESVAGNVTVADLAAQIQVILGNRGLGEIRVSAVADRLHFATVGIGVGKSLEASVTSITTAREEDYSFNFFNFRYVLSATRFRPTVVTKGGLGFPAGANSGVGDDFPLRLIEVPLPGSAPLGQGISDSLAIVGRRDVQFEAPGAIRTAEDFGNRQVALLSVTAPDNLVEGANLVFTGTAIDPATIGGALAPADGLKYELRWTLFNLDGTRVTDGIGSRFPFTSVNGGDYRLYFTAQSREPDGATGYPLLVNVHVDNAPPTLEIGADRTAIEGSRITLAGTTLFDPGVNDTVTLDVNWGDGLSDQLVFEPGADIPAALAALGHAYADVGDFQVQVKASDNDGGKTRDSMLVRVRNAPPSVSAGEDRTAQQGNTIVLTPPRNGETGLIPGGVSFHDAGTVGSHVATADWGDGTTGTLTIEEFPTGPEGAPDGVSGNVFGSHRYRTPGRYAVSVSVTDATGGVGTDSFEVIVANVAPVVSTVTPQALDEGQTLDLSTAGVTFTDPGLNDTFAATVDWGDGTTQSVAIEVRGIDEGDNAVFLGRILGSHTYLDNGEYDAIVSVSDGTDTTSTVLKVVVANVAPVIPAGATIPDGIEGRPVSVEIPFADAGILDTHSATVRFADGGATSDIVLFEPNDKSPGFIRFTHTFLQSGVQAFDVNLTDKDGGATTASYSVNVANADPVIAARLIGNNLVEGSPVTLDALVTDVSGDDPFTGTIDWGDRSAPVPVVAVRGEDGTWHVAANHSYADNGTYNVQLAVTDKDGGTGRAMFVAAVANVAPAVTPGSTERNLNQGDTLQMPFRAVGDALLSPYVVFTDGGAADIHTATVDWGDGTTAALQVQEARLGETIGNVIGSHRYLAAGHFTVTVSVSDDDGGVGSSSFRVNVANVAPVVSAGLPVHLIEGATFDLASAGILFNDPGGNDPFAVTVDWGDGTTQPVGFELLPRGEGQTLPVLRKVLGSHTYQDNGHFNLTVNVSDGTVASSTSFAVEVANDVPRLVAGAVLPGGVEGQSTSFTIDFTDAGLLDTHKATIVFTDGGTTSNVVMFEPNNGAPGQIRFSHTFVQSGEQSFDLLLTDQDGGILSTTLTVDVANVAPVVTGHLVGAGFLEGSPVSFEALVADVAGDNPFAASVDWGDGSAPLAATTALGEDGKWHVAATHTYADDGAYAIQLSVSDKDGATGVLSLNADVADVAPVVTISGPDRVFEASPFTLDLSVTDPGDDAIDYWLVDFGDGQGQQRFNGNPSSIQYQYATAGFDHSIVATAVDIDEGGPDGRRTASNTLDVSVGADYLEVTDFTPTASGFAVRFNRTFDASVVNLYSGAGGVAFGTADVIVTQRAARQPVRGSLVIDADKQGFTFVRTGGVLPAGAYDVTIASRANGFLDSKGRALDGDGDGTNGDNYRHSFTVNTVDGPVISIPDLMRGPGQSFVLPVSVTGAAGATSVEFRIGYRPGLVGFRPADAVLGAGLPAGSSFTSSVGDDGSLFVRITLPTALAGNGRIELIRLAADVRTDADYGAAEVLDLRDVLIGIGATSTAGIGDDAIHLVGYLGDASGNGAYGSLDVQRTQRVIGRLDTGFNSFPRIDPVIVGDVNGNGNLNAIDTLRLQQHVAGLLSSTDSLQPRPEIPPIPAGLPPLVFAGPDPVVRIGANPVGRPGSVVTVPITLDTAAGLESSVVRLTYDPAVLEVVSVRKGALAADFQWMIVSDEPGRLVVDMSRLEAMAGGSGNLLEIDFRIKDGSVPGASALDLQSAALNDTRLTLDPAPVPGSDPTDGSVTVIAAPPPPPPSAPLVSGNVDWTGNLNPFQLRDSEVPPPPIVDWMHSPWAKDLSDRLAQPAGTDSTDRPRVALPGRDLLRSLSRVFGR